MPISLVDEYRDVRLRLPVDDRLESAVAIQCQREAAVGERSFGERLREALNDALDWDLRPPTDEQLMYGLYIASSLLVPLDGECVRFQGALQEYVARHAEALATYEQRLRDRVSCD